MQKLLWAVCIKSVFLQLNWRCGSFNWRKNDFIWRFFSGAAIYGCIQQRMTSLPIKSRGKMWSVLPFFISCRKLLLIYSLWSHCVTSSIALCTHADNAVFSQEQKHREAGPAELHRVQQIWTQLECLSHSLPLVNLFILLECGNHSFV